MKRTIALLLAMAGGFTLGWVMAPQVPPRLVEAPPVIIRETWCPTPEQRAHHPTPEEMGVVEPYFKGEPH
jgi:hypothetical protein